MHFYELLGVMLLGGYAGFMLGLIFAIGKYRKKAENKEDDR